MSVVRPPDAGLDVDGSGTQISCSPRPLHLVPKSPKSLAIPPQTHPFAFSMSVAVSLDRKSTRLNSSHSQISYAVFCLKKKKKNRLSHKLKSMNINKYD